MSGAYCTVCAYPYAECHCPHNADMRDIISFTDELPKWQAIRQSVNCPTCDGTRRVRGVNHESPAEPLYPCPDCTDGHPPMERLLAVGARVFLFPVEGRRVVSDFAEGWQACIDFLRSVRP